MKVESFSFDEAAFDSRSSSSVAGVSANLTDLCELPAVEAMSEDATLSELEEDRCLVPSDGLSSRILARYVVCSSSQWVVRSRLAILLACSSVM